MAEFLAGVCRDAHARVAEARCLVGDDELRARAQARSRPPSFSDALAGPGTAVIAEVKRASPSGGQLAWLPDPAARARAYEQGGAAAVSVLTEPAHFQGSLADLERVSQALAVPTLRKDFLVDGYQVWEARAAGAAAVLLIVAALTDAALLELLAETERAGLAALVEVHEPEEARRAGRALAEVGMARPVIGVNARDLRTLTVDPERFSACVRELPGEAISVAESGVAGEGDVVRAARAGADAVLVGTHLVRAADPAAEVRRLVEAGRPHGAARVEERA